MIWTAVMKTTRPLPVRRNITDALTASTRRTSHNCRSRWLKIRGRKSEFWRKRWGFESSQWSWPWMRTFATIHIRSARENSDKENCLTKARKLLKNPMHSVEPRDEVVFLRLKHFCQDQIHNTQNKWLAYKPYNVPPWCKPNISKSRWSLGVSLVRVTL